MTVFFDMHEYLIFTSYHRKHSVCVCGGGPTDGQFSFPIIILSKLRRMCLRCPFHDPYEFLRNQVLKTESRKCHVDGQFSFLIIHVWHLARLKLEQCTSMCANMIAKKMLR
jgi:hypothetical protein